MATSRRRKYQVFVSSTFTDLQAERQEVSKALLKARDYIPAGMELFPAGSRPSWDVIAAELDDSDYVVLIMGNRYGSLADGEDVSYTEKEYDYALEHKIPVLAFLSSADVPITRDQREPDELHDALLRFRDRVSGSRNVESWTNGQELAFHVTNSLRQEVEVRSRPGWVRGEWSPDASPANVAAHTEAPDLDLVAPRIDSSPAHAGPQSTARVGSDVASELARQLAAIEEADEAAFRALQSKMLTAEIVHQAARRAGETGIASGRGVRAQMCDGLYLRLPPIVNEYDGSDYVGLMVEDPAGRQLAYVAWMDERAVDVLRELADALGRVGAYPGSGAYRPVEALQSIAELLLVGLDARRASLTTLASGLLQIEPGWIITERGLVSRSRPSYVIDAKRYDETDWIRHMSSKPWVDPDEFERAFLAAKEFPPPSPYAGYGEPPF